MTLAGKMKTTPYGGGGEMPQGRYYYPFAIQLPTNIPPSFSRLISNDFAEIVYHVKAYVDIPYGRDATHYSHFTVLRPMPISQHMAMAPVSVDRMFDVTCCCCIDKGKVKAKMYMDRTLIAIDRDNLTIHCDIDNSLGQEPVESIEITLVNMLTYKAGYVTEKNRVVAAKHFLKKQIPAGQRAQIAGTIPLPRNIVPSLTTFNVQSDYKITIEMNIPWASDPVQEFNVIVAQSVDETNFSPQINWQSNNYMRLNKGQLSAPEMYYMPPPQPVYQAMLLPFAPPPNAPLPPYQQMQIAPLGLPSPIRGAPAQIQPLGIQMGGGYAQPVTQNVAPPMVSPENVFQVHMGSTGNPNEPLM